jgi:DNA-binding IclR family transcriptional regulator
MNNVRSLERGLEILRSFNFDSVTLTVPDIARRAGMPRSSVYRFLKTLMRSQFIVEFDDNGQRRYAIGPTMLSLARFALGQADLRRVAYPIMRDLAEKVGESVYLSVHQDLSTVCIESIEANTPLRFGQRVGFRCPLYAGTAKTVLAFLEPARRGRIIRRLSFRSLTARTVLDRERLARRLARIQKRGCEISQGEVFEGTKAVGVPIFDPGGEVFAVLTVGAPKARIPRERESEIQSLVTKAAHEITVQIQHTQKGAAVVRRHRPGPSIESTCRPASGSRRPTGM